MGQLIDDLLIFSRMAKTEMQHTEVDLPAMVQEVVNEFQAQTQDRHVIWELQPISAVQGDPAMLRQVYVNLVSNAVKYTRRRDSARIEIGELPNDSPERVFFVRDNGAGFNMAYAEKLFGVFQRLHRADEFEGSGIGLANVRRIVHRHGGRTWAEGKVDQGATIYFSLPKQPLVIYPLVAAESNGHRVAASAGAALDYQPSTNGGPQSTNKDKPANRICAHASP
jgi:light-regulated signal transduction histidine kinase (bacteriophytochrome)